MSTIPEDLVEVLKNLPEPQPGEECYGCHRPVPKVKSDDRPGPARRSVVSVSEPAGEEGTLENLMIAVVNKYKDAWPRDFAAMRNGLGLELVGGRAWKYHVLYFCLYSVLTVGELAPDEGGEMQQV
jgi:hypothetical protein